MGQQDGGNPRFKGPGTQWKTSWKGKIPFCELCFFQDFSVDDFYVDGSALPGGIGTWVAAVVGVGAIEEDEVQVIASNGGSEVGEEGWRLSLVGGPIFFGNQTFFFRFEAGDGSVFVQAEAGAGNLGQLEPQLGVDKLFFRIFAWHEANPFVTDGTILMSVEAAAAGTPGDLAAAYVNDSPEMRVGADRAGVNPLTYPNVVHGVVGGSGIPSDAAATGLVDEVIAPWAAAVEAECQMVAPEPTTNFPITVEVGWRANNPPLPIGQAPTPLEPFVGSETLTYDTDGDVLNVGTQSPVVYGG